MGAMDDDHGGDPVCWLDRVCPECGKFRERPATATCEWCGANVHDDADEPRPGSDADEPDASG
ncbi:hypothetical protein [Yinghuangia soli]|uniref:Uncharacterized protein n=1 Tax=Yinghuangia soli TaxID=2908204 RepID=A0AA41TYT3_9ACTN|nr:hypothetical protein [Yinghuangia soli]MCF2526515.1 hypothetical protein [Yinghuangia soli]